MKEPTYIIGQVAHDNKKIDVQAGFQIDTLDEPIMDTIWRDIHMITYKLKYVLCPKFREEQGKELRNWDMWGPILLTMLLALTLGIHSKEGIDKIFAIVFTLIFGGATIVTLNARILGGQVYLMQCICVLGYCIFPINIAALLIAFFRNSFAIHHKLFFVIVAYIWACFSSVGFMSSLMTEDKKAIAVYPIFLFYLFLSWFCLLQ